MTIKEFGECVEYNIRHNLKHAVLGLGAPGVGKSQLIRQIGAKYGYKVIDIRLAQMSEVEIGGLIYPNESRTKTVWLSPEILPDEERDGPNTILLLDEITSCTKRVQVAAYQLILDRRIGQYKLPEGTFVVALGNREDDDGVYIRLAGPLADRFEIHYIEPDFNGWKYDFALKNGVHPWVVSYLTFHPSSLHTQKDDPEAIVFATPRSWVRVSDILKYDSDIRKPVVRNKVIGNVGTAEGTQFLEYCEKKGAKKQQFVTAQEYLYQNAGAPRDPEMMAILTDAIVAEASFLSNVSREDELTQEQRAVLDTVIRGLFRFPTSEYTVLGLKGLLEKNRPVVKEVFYRIEDPSITEFFKHNAYLIGLGDDVDAQNRRKRWLAMWED